MSPPERFPPDDPREWLNRARSNLIRAKSKLSGVYLEDLCFDAQQATEKAIKAIMIRRNVEFPYVHDLGRLLLRLEEAGEPIPELESGKLRNSPDTLWSPAILALRGLFPNRSMLKRWSGREGRPMGEGTPVIPGQWKHLAQGHERLRRSMGQKPMEKHKKQQLTARGWKAGSTDEFLELTPEEAAYIELKLVLSDHLKQQRQHHKLTQGELGQYSDRVNHGSPRWRLETLQCLSTCLCALSGLRNFERRLSSHDCTAGTSDCYLTAARRIRRVEAIIATILNWAEEVVRR